MLFFHRRQADIDAAQDKLDNAETQDEIDEAQAELNQATR